MRIHFRVAKSHARMALALYGTSLLAFYVPALSQQPAAPKTPPVVEKYRPLELDADRIPTIKTTGTILLKGATILTVTKGTIVGGDILIINGKISAIGKDISAPPGVVTVDCKGRFITPGIVDAHSHIGMDSVNEGSDSITAEVRMRDVIDPDALSFYRQLSNGTTAALLLHGSANAVGGQSVVVKLKWKHSVEQIVVPDAPRMIKFALGENVTRAGGRGFGGNGPTRFPDSRMGVEAVYRRGFEAARGYIAAWDSYEKQRLANGNIAPPRRDLRLETLADILRGKIRVQCHSYRADEMLMMLRLSKEYHFSLVLQHALEAYKITPEIIAAHASVSTFADAWAYKVEANDAIPYNAALCMNAGIVTSVNSDNEGGTDRLNIEAANCMKYGGLSQNDALKLITINPAIQLGIDHRTGSLEVGKDGDVTVWSGYPLSVYSKCDLTVVEGETLYQRRDAFKMDAHSTLTGTVPADVVFSSASHTNQRTASTTGAIIDTIVPPVLPGHNSYAIVGATIHPISSADIVDGTVIVENGKITAIGKKLPIPRAAFVVNAKGLQLYPGLIDSSSVMGMTEIEAIPVTIDVSENSDFEPDLLATTAVNPGSEHFAIARNNGITAAGVSPNGGLVAGQIGVINLAGWTPELMSVKSPAGLRVSFPEPMRPNARFASFMTPEQLTQMRDRDSQRLRLLKDFFGRAKLYATAHAAGVQKSNLSMEAMLPYVTGKSPIVFTVGSAVGAKAAIKFAEDNGLKAVLSGGPDVWKEAELLAQKKIPYILSIPANNSISELAPIEDYDPTDTVWSAAAVLDAAGVRISFQSDSASEVKNLPRQVGIMCAYGLSHDAALRALTINASETLGVSDRMGSVEVGKIANLVLTDGDILEVTTQVRYLFISGKPVKLESKHTQLYDLYHQRLKDIH